MPVKYTRALDDYKINAIWSELKKHDKMGYNQLQNIMVENRHMSSRIFRERLAYMVDIGLVKRMPEEGSQRIWYTVRPEMALVESKAVERNRAELDTLEEQIVLLEKSWDKNSMDENAETVISFLRLLAQNEMTISVYSRLFEKNQTLRQLQERLNKLTNRLLRFVYVEWKRKNVSLVGNIISALEADRREEYNRFFYGFHRPM